MLEKNHLRKLLLKELDDYRRNRKLLEEAMRHIQEINARLINYANSNMEKPRKGRRSLNTPIVREILLDDKGSQRQIANHLASRLETLDIALSCLQFKERRIIDLVHFQRFSMDKTAAAMKIDARTVRRKYNIAIKRMLLLYYGSY